LILKFII